MKPKRRPHRWRRIAHSNAHGALGFTDHCERCGCVHIVTLDGGPRGGRLDEWKRKQGAGWAEPCVRCPPCTEG